MSSLNMSLDDIITMNKHKQLPQPSSSPPPHFGPVPSRRFFNRTVHRSSPYPHLQVEAPKTMWKHDMFAQYAAAHVSYPHLQVEAPATKWKHDRFAEYAAAHVSYTPMFDRLYYVDTATKILVSNLTCDLSEDDIKDLFSVVGEVKNVSVHYDKTGRSEGRAEVVYSQWKDAEAAVKRYNNIQLDGKPMEVKMVGMVTATSALMSPYGYYGPRRDEGRGRELIGLIQGGDMHTRGRGLQRRNRGKAYESVSAGDLDADLDKYHADAKQTH